MTWASTLILLVVAARAATPPRPAPPEAAREILAERARTEAWLKSAPDSYLAAVARKDFGGKKTLTVGRAPDNDIRLEDEGIESHHLRVSVQGDRFLVESAGGQARFLIQGRSERRALLEPGKISVSRFILRLSHQNFPAIIVFDPKSPRFKRYKGLRYFPVDLSYRYVLPLLPPPSREEAVILSIRGHQRRAIKAGRFEFEVAGRPCRLEAYRLLEPGVGENDLSLLFRDATTGRETYKLGRYLDPKRLPDGKFLLDFNEAYNPACAFSPHYNCPIPPTENTLSVAIRAGEKDPRYH